MEGLIELTERIEKDLYKPAKLPNVCRKIELNERLVTIGTGLANSKYLDASPVLRQAYLTTMDNHNCIKFSTYPEDVRSIICTNSDMNQVMYSGDSGIIYT